MTNNPASPNPKNTGAWFVRDHASGWVKFGHEMDALRYARESGAAMIYRHDGTYPKLVSPIQITERPDGKFEAILMSEDHHGIGNTRHAALLELALFWCEREHYKPIGHVK